MKFCPYCGKYNTNQNGNFCMNCGAMLKNANNYQNNYNYNNNQSSDVLARDEYSILWGILGFFIPMAGLILFIAWHKDRPKSGRYAGVGALLRVILTIILIIFLVFFAILVEPDKDRDRSGRYQPYENRERYEDDNLA